MPSASEILKALEQSPEWKTIIELPQRVAELERRLNAVETQRRQLPASEVPEGRKCPKCGGIMDVISESDHPTFAFAGRKVHAMECSNCGNKATRDFTPGKGYK